MPEILKREELFLFLCLHSSQSPILGDFYNDKPVSRSDEVFNKIRGESKSGLSSAYSDWSSLGPDSLDVSSYTHGSPVRTYKDAKLFPAVKGKRNGFLSLPTKSLDSETCIWNDPVRFLEDVALECFLNLTSDSCETQNTIDANFYQKRQTEIVGESPRILSRGSDVESVFGAKDIRVRYLLKVPTVSPKKTVDRNGVYLFPNRSHPLDFSQFDLKPFQLQAQTTVPAAPKYEASKCKNAVSEVFYDFIWNGSLALSISATIILEDIRIESKGSNIYQVNIFWKSFAINL